MLILPQRNQTQPEQPAAGVFPIKLKAEDWDSGEVSWLFDVIAPSKTLTSKVIRNLKQVIKGGDLNIHPLVAKLVDESALEAMGAKRPSKNMSEEAPDVGASTEDNSTDQTSAGVFPIKLKAEDWDSGEMNWLFDVIAPSKTLTSKVIRNLKQVIKGGDLNIPPLVAKLSDSVALEAMGAKRQAQLAPKVQESSDPVSESTVDEILDTQDNTQPTRH